LANASFNELEQLAQACQPASLSGVTGEAMTATDQLQDGKVVKMDPGRFAPLLMPDQTELVKIIRDYHFEGDLTDQRLRIELRELNVYGMHFIVTNYIPADIQVPYYPP
jgi:hypothetical protein